MKVFARSLNWSRKKKCNTVKSTTKPIKTILFASNQYNNIQINKIKLSFWARHHKMLIHSIQSWKMKQLYLNYVLISNPKTLG